MNDIIEIKEKFLIDDSHSKIRGFVSAYDENGNRLFLKENMIVKSGRELIMTSLIEGKKLFTTAGGNDGKLYAFIGNSTQFTKPEDNYLTYFGGNAVNVKEIELTPITENETSVAPIIPNTTEEPFIKITFDVKSDGNDVIEGTRWGSLGLFFEDSSENRTLISRVTFPPYSQSATLRFHYYIYF